MFRLRGTSPRVDRGMTMRGVKGWWLLLALAATGASQAQDEATDAEEPSGPHDFSATLTGTTDYVFRGVSQTQEDPAFQASLEYAHESGFYAGLWGSTIDFTPDGTPTEDEDDANVEIDTYVGWRFAISEDFGADVQLVRYNYPGTADGVDYDYNELIGKLSWSWLTFTLGWSNDVFNLDESGTYLSVGGEWALPAELTLTAGFGHYDLDDALGDSYNDWSVGIGRSWGPVDVSVAYYDTDGSGEDLFGTLADDRIVGTVTLNFD
jgi:uncharacterized protein (TIGR02001 family)